MNPYETRVVLRDGMYFEGLTDDPSEDQFAIQLDADPESGGQDKGIRPARLLLTALAGCMGMDIISILRKKKQQVQAFEVSVKGDRASEHPMVYTHIWVKVQVTGKQIDPSAVTRAIELSLTKYCPIANLIKTVVPIETDYEIIEG